MSLAWQLCATWLVLAAPPVHVAAQARNATSLEGPQRLPSHRQGQPVHVAAQPQNGTDLKGPQQLASQSQGLPVHVAAQARNGTSPEGQQQLLGQKRGQAFLASAGSAYSQGDAIRFAHLSAAAYCHTVAPAWHCGVHCERVPGMHDVRKIDDYSWGAHAYVGRLGGQCVLAFRGTDSVQGWVQDLQSIRLERLPGCSFRGRSCEVGKGFYDDYRALARRVEDKLAAIGCGKSNALVVTGHSLGAALATLAAFELRRHGYHVAKVYTFGQPRVGNAAFAGAFNSAMASIPTFRVSRADDPVIYVPPPGHFHHVGREVFYRGGSRAGYRVCNGSGEDRSCSGRDPGPVGVSMMLGACMNPHTCGHSNYLVPDMPGPAFGGFHCRRRLSDSERAPAPPAQTPASASAPAPPAAAAVAPGFTPAPAILFP